MPWTVAPHTADLAIEVQARSPEDLYVEALRAFTDCVTDIVAVRPLMRDEIVVRAADSELLLVEWLQELLTRFEVWRQLYVLAEVELRRGGEWLELRAVARGEPYDAERHPLKVAIKAVTYHGLRVWEDVDGWRATVVFDV
jgi:SHS2 domain-containing protein